MAATAPQITATLPQPLYDQLVQVQTAQQLDSVEAALISILSSYFEASSRPDPHARIDGLEKVVGDLSTQINSLTEAVAIIATRIDLMVELPISGEQASDPSAADS